MAGCCVEDVGLKAFEAFDVIEDMMILLVHGNMSKMKNIMTPFNVVDIVIRSARRDINDMVHEQIMIEDGLRNKV